MRRLEEAVVRPLRLLVTLVGVFQLITSIRMRDTRGCRRALSK